MGQILKDSLMKTLIGIITYCNSEERFKEIKKFFNSFLTNNLRNYEVFISDDCSPYDKHRKFLHKLPFKINIRGINGGIARNTNEIFKYYQDGIYENLIILNDDIIFNKPGVLDIYDYLVSNSKQNHLSFYADKQNKKKFVQKVNNFNIYSYGGTNGVLLAINRVCFMKIGAFFIPPAPYGLEHANYTDRAKCAGLCDEHPDFEESSEYITIPQNKSTFTGEQQEQFVQQNVIFLSTVRTKLYGEVIT